MTYMTKNFWIIFLLSISSCAQISYSDAIPLLRTALIGAQDIEVDSSFIESREYSFAKVRLGRSAIAIMTLSTINKDNIYKWVNASGESIYTFNGKIIKSEGIVYDMEIFNYDGFNMPDLKNLELITNSYDMMLLNPRGFVSQLSTIKYDESIIGESLIRYTETVSSDGFKWNFKNVYYVDVDTNRVVKSEQFIHPKYPKVEISYYYK